MRGLRAQIAGPIALDLARPFVTARGRVSARHATLVRVGDGVRWGYGEATPLEGFSEETTSQAWAALGQIAERLAGMAPPDTVEEVGALVG